MRKFEKHTSQSVAQEQNQMVYFWIQSTVELWLKTRWNYDVHSKRNVIRCDLEGIGYIRSGKVGLYYNIDNI